MKSRLGTVPSKKVQTSPGLPQGAPESPVTSTMITELGSERLVQELDGSETGMEFGRLCAGCDLLRRRCGSGRSVGCGCKSDGGRSDRKIEGSGFDSWCTDNTLDEPPEDDERKHQGGRVGCGVGRGFGICGIGGVSGWKRETHDCTHISSSEQNFGEMENSFDLIVARKFCLNIVLVAGFSMEFERGDDCESSMRQNVELEKRDWSETAPWMEMDQ